MDSGDSNTQQEGDMQVIHCEIIRAVERWGTVNVFVICLDREDGDHNIIDRNFGWQLARAGLQAREMARKGEVDVVAVCSAKKGSFMAGADILYELKFVGIEGGQRAFADARQLQNVFCMLEALPVPTVALLNGITLGGGLELALACDYRIADPDKCKQIGLPEVKIGVIPGGGGCCRLPRLIGFRQSLSLLLTGQAINAQKALKLGIVDCLMPNMETVVRKEQKGGEGKSYEYKWLSGLVACVEQRKVGKRLFHVRTRPEALVAEAITVNVEGAMGSLSEVELMSRLSESWEECEAKAAVKYPTPPGKGRLILSYLLNTVFYIVALLQLLKQVRFRMPAPYACLQTTFRCLYAGSWMEAMALNALGFASMATTAETKSLMMLFLVTRKLKKFALMFGLDADAKPQGNLDIQNTAIFVLISKAGLQFSSAFIQSLLYAGFKVYVVDVGENISRKKVSELVNRHFHYALKRGYMKLPEVEAKMEGLHFLNLDIFREQKMAEGTKQLCIIVNALFLSEEAGGSAEALASQLDVWKIKVVRLALNPHPQTLTHPGMILVNVGDPLRKNTLCVELSPTGSQVPPEDLRLAAAFTSTMGKFPVITSPSHLLHSIAHFVTISHWALGANLVAEGGAITPGQVDSCLLSAGFSKGPFATIKELDPAYVGQIIELGVQSHLGLNCTALQHFVTHGKFIVKHKATWGSCSKILSMLPDLFLLNIVVSALLAKNVSQDVSEAAVDVLCVSGLVHFPPTEGGPLSYFARIGKTSVLEKLQALAKNPWLHSQAQWLIRKAESLLPQETDKLFVKPQTEFKFSSQISELQVLSAAELAQTGPAKGAQNFEVFLYPISIILLCMALIIVGILAVLW